MGSKLLRRVVREVVIETEVRCPACQRIKKVRGQMNKALRCKCGERIVAVTNLA